MAVKAKAVAIKFGVEDTWEGGFVGFGMKKTGKAKKTGSLWDYWYKPKQDLDKFSNRAKPILGPGCKIKPRKNYACFAATADYDDVEKAYNHVTLRKQGYGSFLYLDVGFWGGKTDRSFGLICGNTCWLCEFGTCGGAPKYPFAKPGDLPYHETLFLFYKLMNNFTVRTVAMGTGSSYYRNITQEIYLILPDMHMWPDPTLLAKGKDEFFTADEKKELKQAVQEGKLIVKKDSYDIPLDKNHPDPERETDADYALRLVSTHEGRLAMKYNALNDVDMMQAEEKNLGFGPTAGRDLIKLLEAVQARRKDGFDVHVIHLGDLLEMWAPHHTAIDNQPFEENLPLKLNPEAKKNVPKWLKLIYKNRNNRDALDKLAEVGCDLVHGNHDVYMALPWQKSNIPALDRLMNSPSFRYEELFWFEHGHRFQTSNQDGYWLMGQGPLNDPPGPVVTSAVNYYPYFRKFGDKYDNSDDNLYGQNIPSAAVWYLLAHVAEVAKSDVFHKPPPFKIFCQGHTHKPVLLKVEIRWVKSTGKGAEFEATGPGPGSE